MRKFLTNKYVLGSALTIAVLLIVGWPLLKDAPSEADKTKQAQPVSPQKAKATPRGRDTRERALAETSLRVHQIPGSGTLERVREARKSRLRPGFLLFGNDLVITTAASNELELTEADQDFLQDSVSRILDSAKLEALKHMRPDSKRSDPSNGIRAFIVDAFDFNPSFDTFA